MIKKESQRLTYTMLENYPSHREMINGKLLYIEDIVRISLLNMGFEKMWELLSEEEQHELKSVVLDKEGLNG